MNLRNLNQYDFDVLYDKAKKYDQIIDEYNARWKSVEVHERLKKRLEYLENWKGIKKEWHDRTVEELHRILNGEI